VYERQKEPLDLFAFHTFLRVAPEWSPTILEIKKNMRRAKHAYFQRKSILLRRNGWSTWRAGRERQQFLQLQNNNFIAHSDSPANCKTNGVSWNFPQINRFRVMARFLQFGEQDAYPYGWNDFAINSTIFTKIIFADSDSPANCKTNGVSWNFPQANRFRVMARFLCFDEYLGARRFAAARAGSMRGKKNHSIFLRFIPSLLVSPQWPQIANYI
jgi:hypothetical protein